MKPIFLGLCAILSPFLYDNYKRNDKIKRKLLLENIKRKYQLVDEKTDISKVSYDYPVIVYKKVQCGAIIDYDFGLKFADALGIKRKIEIVDKDTLTENSLQPTKYRAISDSALSELTNGKFKNSEFYFPAKHAHIDKVKLKDYFFTKFQKEICQVASSSTSLISNPKTSEGRVILQNENDPHNKYLADKFLDFYTAGNNVFIQASKNKLLKNDLKINYLTYKPVNFLLIGCKEKPIKLTDKNKAAAQPNAAGVSDSDKQALDNEGNREFELVLQPATRYYAQDYVVIPYQIQDETRAKEEIDKVLVEEINKLELKPWEKKIRKVFYIGGFVFIGYGYIVYKIRHSFTWKIKDLLMGIFSLVQALL